MKTRKTKVWVTRDKIGSGTERIAFMCFWPVDTNLRLDKDTGYWKSTSKREPTDVFTEKKFPLLRKVFGLPRRGRKRLIEITVRGVNHEQNRT